MIPAPSAASAGKQVTAQKQPAVSNAPPVTSAGGQVTSVLISSRGSDKLQGGKGQDLAALDQVLAKWASPASYDTQMGDLLATLLTPASQSSTTGRRTT